ncbi:helix-turn-helix domain-containing protein [Micromonospora noduli]|uniref:Nucleoid-associated protein EspR n=1 Tax=Micromonospora noduli TaxID=709876 RepID=A0ABX9D2Z7_9ACTN|nr:helix-turn-helix domain-containing protein [Micromonospora noduli]RAO12418.1 Nucleoid-associated protein EspR [Micromonospora noduli]RAO20218.1 Nucleoid-associated protein EspR [Micromonospora noduli]
MGNRGPTIADKLDRLFKTVRPGGREYSYEEVATRIRATGVMISHTYVWQLRKGHRDNPTIRHIEALARFFGVSPVYFLDNEAARQIDEQLELLAALSDKSVRHVAMRVAGLSAPSLEAINGMIEHARRIDRLTEAEDDPSRQPAAPTPDDMQ